MSTTTIPTTASVMFRPRLSRTSSSIAMLHLRAGWGRATVASSSRTGHHRVAERPKLIDLDFDLVAGLEEHRRLAGEADAGGRAGEDEIAHLQSEYVRQVGDGLRHREDQ